MEVIQSKHDKRHQFEFEIYSFILGVFLFFLRTPPIFLSAGEQTEEADTKNRERRSLKIFGTMKCLTIRKQEENCGIRFTALMIYNVHFTYWRVKNTHSYGRINGWLKESVPKCTRGPQESLKVWSCFFQHSTFTFLFHAFTVQSIRRKRRGRLTMMDSSPPTNLHMTSSTSSQLVHPTLDHLTASFEFSSLFSSGPRVVLVTSDHVEVPGPFSLF